MTLFLRFLCKNSVSTKKNQFLLPKAMKIFKILTAEIIFYIILILAAIVYYMINGVDAENQTDFLISLIMLTILCTITINKINDNIKSLKKN